MQHLPLLIRPDGAVAARYSCVVDPTGVLVVRAGTGEEILVLDTAVDMEETARQ